MAAMLTSERLSEVSWALDKMREGRKAVEKLLDGEPQGQQPPPDRLVTMRKIEVDLARLEKELEGLFS